jgi:GNAT superfamily N-acetyltransferase
MLIEEIKASETWEIRRQVMWPDKPVDYVKLADDDDGFHFGLFEGNELISVISLFINNQKGQFRKFATKKEKQGRGYGSALLNFIFERAKEYDLDYIWCNARNTKAAFYEKFGMRKTHSTFLKGGITYVVMDKNLSA